MNDRKALQAQFLMKADWGNAVIRPLAGDASNRRYDRLTHPNGQTAVLMDAPLEKGEDVRPFVKIATYLNAIGLSAPLIFAIDAENGFLLIEDLGDGLFAREVITHPEHEKMLYCGAIDVLSHLHRAPTPDLPAYDAATTVPLAAMAFDWYQFGATGSVDAISRSAFCDLFNAVIGPLDRQANVLIQRDYHAENLLWLPDRVGIKRVGLLDFQSAMIGHPVYDLVSILQDARRDMHKDLETEMKSRFLAQNSHIRDGFEAAYAIMALQRNLRILGIFTRLCLRDGKAHYVDLIPRVWGHIQTNLEHPALASLNPVIHSKLPSPDTAVLSLLKSKRASCPDR